MSGKTLDQVTDMMVANSSNLIITVKPTNQKYNLNKSTSALGMPKLSQSMPKHATHVATSSASTTTSSVDVSKLSAKSSDAATAAAPSQPTVNNNGSIASSSSVNSSFSSSNQQSINRYSALPPLSYDHCTQDLDQRHSFKATNGSKGVAPLKPTADNDRGKDSEDDVSDDDDDDDDEEIHDATNSHNHHYHRSSPDDTGDDKILTL